VVAPFQTFDLEHWQSEYEQTVAHNLADSSITGVSLGDLLGADTDIERLLAVDLHYPEVNGERELRERIAARYPGIGADDVLVTVGASEANALIVDAFCPPGARVIVMEPGYRQVWGLARNRGCDVVGFPLDPTTGWAPDLAALRERAMPGTALIYVCNPNNPVGYVLSDAEIDEIVDIAASCGAWLVADEVYQGTERDPASARTFVGRYERVIGVNSLSKAFGLSGLRIGWAVGPRDAVDALWRRHEYAVISTGRLDNVLAALALEPSRAQRILDRNRAAVHAGWEVFADWAATLDGAVAAHRPMATPLVFARFRTELGSVETCDRLRQEASTLLAPGTFFGCEGYARLNVGLGRDAVSAALEAMVPVVEALAT
jgi:aspartate/methionine/tyrosine aminotransferase